MKCHGIENLSYHKCQDKCFDICHVTFMYSQGRAAGVASAVPHPTGLFCGVKTEGTVKATKLFLKERVSNVS